METETRTLVDGKPTSSRFAAPVTSYAIETSES